MFAYCKNNPIVYADISGNACYPCTFHVNDSGTGVNHGTGYPTPDEAAIAFASEWYDNRGGLERGAVIVRFYKNGQPRYQYDAVTKGTRQHVSIDYSNYLGDYTHNGAIMVGDVHTHPKSSVFSKDDVDSYSNMLKQYPDSRFYLAGDDAGVYKYNPNNSNPLRGDYIGSFTPVHGFVTVGSTGSSPTVNNFSLLR